MLKPEIMIGIISNNIAIPIKKVILYIGILIFSSQIFLLGSKKGTTSRLFNFLKTEYLLIRRYVLVFSTYEMCMSKFFVFYYASPEVMEEMQMMTPEEGAKMMKDWFEWGARCGDNMIDLGAPLVKGHKVTMDGAEPLNQVMGSYSILQADSMDDAMKLLDGHPHLSWGPIEIYEAMPPPKM
jgi:hypothetical protein